MMIHSEDWNCLDDMIVSVRERNGVSDLPLEIHAHPDIVGAVKAIVEGRQIEGVTVVSDDGIAVMVSDDGAKRSDLVFYGVVETVA